MSELRILLVEDCLADGVLTERALQGGDDGAHFALTCLRAGAQAYREKGRIDSTDLRHILSRAIEGER